MLTEIFKQFSDRTIRTLPPNSTFFRGGETDSDLPVTPRLGNIFLSTNNATCRRYADFWKLRDYSYIYRAVSVREVRLVRVNSMASCVFQSLEYLGLPNRIANTWQRDELIKIARQSVPDGSIDGIYFEDQANLTEVILDNSGKLIDIVDQAVFRKEEAPQYAALINRVCKIQG